MTNKHKKYYTGQIENHDYKTKYLFEGLDLGMDNLVIYIFDYW